MEEHGINERKERKVGERGRERKRKECDIKSRKRWTECKK